MSAVALLAGCKGLGAQNPPPKGGGTAPPITVQTQTTGGNVNTVTTTGVACTDPTLPTQAENVIGKACETCHGPAPAPQYDGFGDALDPVAMVTDGWVVANHSDQSKIYIEISPGVNGDPPAMPTADGGGPLVASEIAVVKSWIDCGAVPWTNTTTQGGTVTDPSSRGFLPAEVAFLAAEDDVSRLTSVSDSQSQPDRVDARYISLINLYNAGVPADRIKLFAQGVEKALWNLTVTSRPPPLVAVPLDGVTLPFSGSPITVSDGLGSSLLWRVDEKAWQWDPASLSAARNQNIDHDIWEELLKAYPYAVQFDNTFLEAADLVQDTKSRVPIINGDWFDDRAGIAPLYFDVLGIPNDFDAYYQQFGGINELDQLADPAGFDVACVGMDGNASLVSNFNRIQCRYRNTSVEGSNYCWNSEDFANETQGANIFSDPLPIADQANNIGGFTNFRAGGEAFCGLPDGQQSYFVFANKVAAGQGNIRLDDAPSNVVTDYSPDSDRVVHTAGSCWHCHESGVIERDDQMLTAVESNSSFGQEVKQEVADLYPGNDALPTIYQNDITDFTNALNTMGVAVGEEPTWALNRDYETPLSIDRVGADFGLRGEVFVGEVQVNDALQEAYSSLGNGTSSTVDFQIVEGAALETNCELGQGDPCNAVDLANFEAGNNNFDGTGFCGQIRNGFYVGGPVPCPQGSACDVVNGTCSTNF